MRTRDSRHAQARAHTRRRLRRCALATLLLTATAAALAQPSRESLDAYVESVRASFDVPGVAVAVVKDDAVALLHGYGERAPAGAPVDERTRFPIASLTKAFTAVALALLVEGGRLQWDAPVVEHLPEFALADSYVTRHISARDLLVHNSGLAAGAGDLLWWPATTHSAAELIRRLRHLPLERSFRQGYAYDNVLYTVAGELIARVSGQSWGNFVQRRILGPLEMGDTLLRRPGFLAEDNVAHPHAAIDGSVRVVDPFEDDKTNPAGGLIASAQDMAQWLRVLLARGRIDDASRLYSDESADALASIVTPMPQVEPPCGIAALRTRFRGYAPGFVVQDYRGHKLLTHSGGAPGYVSQLALVPGEKLGIVVLTNQQSMAAVVAIMQQLLDSHLGVGDIDWLRTMRDCERELKAKRADAAAASASLRSRNTRPHLPLAAYAGRYRDAWYGDIEIRRRGGALELEFLHTPALIGDMQHWQHETFVVRWRKAPLPPNDAFIRFTLGADGGIESARMAPVSPLTDFSYDFAHLRLIPVTP